MEEQKVVETELAVAAAAVLALLVTRQADQAQHQTTEAVGTVRRIQFPAVPLHRAAVEVAVA